MKFVQTIRSNIAVRGAHYFWRSLLPPPLSAVEIETTTICNRKCNYCPNFTVGRPPRLMEESVFYRIIDSLKKIDFAGRISPHFYGEPLTDRRLESLLSYAHTSLPRASIKLFTNGELLTVDRYLALKEAGVAMFRISQHTECPSDTIEKTLAHIRDHHPDLYTIEYVDYFNDHAMKLNRGGLVNVNPSRMRFCTLVDQLTFDYEGNAVLCCNDYQSSYVFGNIREREADQLWHDPQYRRIRNLIASGFWPYDICKICSGMKT